MSATPSPDGLTLLTTLIEEPENAHGLALVNVRELAGRLGWTEQRMRAALIDLERSGRVSTLAFINKRRSPQAG